MRRSGMAALFVIAGAVLLTFVGALQTSAGTIVVTEGSADFVGQWGSVNLGGEGFTMAASAFALGGLFGPATCSPCSPGTVISLRAMFSGSDLPGSATLGGVSFQLGPGPPATNASALVDFTGSVLAPEFDGAATVTLTAPFDLVGGFRHPACPLCPAPATGDSIIGAGIAELTLGRLAGPIGDSWAYRSVSYELQSVPEPASLLFVGSGLVAAGVMGWRRLLRRAGATNPRSHTTP